MAEQALYLGRGEHAMAACSAFQADIGPDAHDGPLIAAARMGFSQANNGANVNRRERDRRHARIIGR